MSQTDIDRLRLLAELRKHPSLSIVADVTTATKIYDANVGAGRRIEWLCGAIRKAAFKVTAGATANAILSVLLGHCVRANATDVEDFEPRPPRVEATGPSFQRRPAAPDVHRTPEADSAALERQLAVSNAEHVRRTQERTEANLAAARADGKEPDPF